MRNSTLVRLVAIATIAVVGSCSGNSYGTTGLGNNNQGSTSDAIDVNDNNFNPSSTTVPNGTAVTWTWRGSNNHSVTFDDGATSPTQASGTYQRTFSTAGTYRYHCLVHGAAMSGTINVQ